jgi:hypothetical protein
MREDRIDLNDWEDRNSQPRRIDEIREAARQKRVRENRNHEILVRILGIFFGFFVAISALAVVGIIVGAAFWVLTGKPIF